MSKITYNTVKFERGNEISVPFTLKPAKRPKYDGRDSYGAQCAAMQMAAAYGEAFFMMPVYSGSSNIVWGIVAESVLNKNAPAYGQNVVRIRVENGIAYGESLKTIK